MTDKPLLFRMDSGNDALENMLLLHWNDPQIKFLIKHNFRRENRYEITERTMTADGQMLFMTDTEINMYWTSLGVSDEEIIELYHNHAVCEQYHSEIKTDMGIERLPSGKFETNALILKLTMIAYNIFRIIGTESMKKNDMPVRHSTIKRRRIRTIIDNLILIAGHLTVHARKLRLALGRSNGWIQTFLRLASAF